MHRYLDHLHHSGGDVTGLDVYAAGSRGGPAANNEADNENPGGKGGEVSGIVATTPGQRYGITVGCGATTGAFGLGGGGQNGYGGHGKYQGNGGGGTALVESNGAKLRRRGRWRRRGGRRLVFSSAGSVRGGTGGGGGVAAERRPNRPGWQSRQRWRRRSQAGPVGGNGDRRGPASALASVVVGAAGGALGRRGWHVGHDGAGGGGGGGGLSAFRVVTGHLVTRVMTAPTTAMAFWSSRRRRRLRRRL